VLTATSLLSLCFSLVMKSSSEIGEPNSFVQAAQKFVREENRCSILFANDCKGSKYPPPHMRAIVLAAAPTPCDAVKTRLQNPSAVSQGLLQTVTRMYTVEGPASLLDLSRAWAGWRRLWRSLMAWKWIEREIDR
jgi:hypothetical protein